MIKEGQAMETLLTMSDVAKRWQLHPSTIRNWVNDGTLTPVKGIPTVRFSLSYIQKIEEVQIDKLSPLERKRLENEIERLQQENERLRDATRAIFQQASQVMGI